MTERRNPFSWSLAGALALFAILWLLDFPKPMVDDLFHCGAGLNLAAGGDFSNPLMIRQQFPGHYFFMYPPVHPHAIFWWLKVFGVGAAAMTGFQMFMYFITAAATIALLRRHGAPAWLEWLVPLGVSSAFLNIGLRPEPMAVALTMAGFAVVDACGRNKTGCGLGFFLLCLGVATSPRTAPFGVVLVALAALELRRDCGATGPQRRTLCLCALGGLLASVLVFLCLIDFRLGEFLAVFRFHSNHRVDGDKLALLVRFLQRFVGVTQWPVLAMLPVLCIAALRRPLDNLVRLGLCLTCAFPCVALIGALGHGAVWFAILGLLVLTTSVLQRTASRSWKLGLASLVCAIFVAANGKHAVNVLGILSGRIQSDMGDNRGEALALRPTPDHPLLLDSSVARYVFNYQIPAGCLDWSFAAPFPAETVTDAPLRPGDVFLIGPYSVDILGNKGYLDLATAKWTPPGLRRWAYDQFPRRAYIIRAEDCKEPVRNPAAPPGK